MSDTDLDAVVVGSGPNGLAAAVTLAGAGLRVRVYEEADHIGGGARTEELTVPGFRHDPCSAVHPLGIASPFFASLPLEKHGLEWVLPDLELAHPFDDGGALFLSRSADETASALGEDAAAYRRWVGPFLGRWEELAGDILRPLTAGPPRHAVLSARFALRAGPPVAVLTRLFRNPRTKALVSGLAGHTIAPLRTVGTGGVATMFAVTAHERGWAFARGGSQAVSDALAGVLADRGGEIVTGHRVASLDDLPPVRAFLLDVSVPGLIALAGSRLPGRFVGRLRRVKQGGAVFKLDYALSGPMPWRAEECRRAGTVHLGPSLTEISGALSAVARGRAPDPPFLIVAQPSLFDPSRAPTGRHVLWVYGHVPYRWDGDLTGAVEAQLERFAPGWRDLVLGRRAMGPAALEAHNANNVGGDISNGAFGGVHAVFRPLVRLSPYSTPDPSVWLCSSATPPGPGVHGLCGHHAAVAVLRHRFPGRRPDAGPGDR